MLSPAQASLTPRGYYSWGRGQRTARARCAHLLDAPRRGHARLAARGDRPLPVRPQLADRAERALVQPDEVELRAARLLHLAADLGQRGDPIETPRRRPACCAPTRRPRRSPPSSSPAPRSRPGAAPPCPRPGRRCGRARRAVLVDKAVEQIINNDSENGQNADGRGFFALKSVVG